MSYQISACPTYVFKCSAKESCQRHRFGRWSCVYSRIRIGVTYAGADSLVHVSQDALPGDAFALSMNKVWEVIRSQKDLNLPAHKV